MEVDISSWAAYLIGYLIYFHYLYYLALYLIITNYCSVQVCVVPPKPFELKRMQLNCEFLRCLRFPLDSKTERNNQG